MTTPPVIDRQLLGDAVLALDDDTYVQVIAGVGVSWESWISSAWGSQKCISWTPHNYRIAREQLKNQPVASLFQYQTEWINQLGDSAYKRVLIRGQEFDNPDAPDLDAIARILNHPAVGADSVFVEWNASRADLRWQWPLRIAAFANDLKALGLANLCKVWPSSSLVEVQALTREQARCEVLVIPGSVRDGLRRILELSHSVRAGHILLLGPVDIAWRELRSHVDALFAETQAGALSIVSLPDSLPVSERLNHWVQELSHNAPYDIALARAFPRETSLHIVDLRLLDEAALTNVARDLGRRLRRLSPKVTFTLPRETPRRINVDWTMAKPPADLGMTLEEHYEALPFGGESEGATGLSEIAVAARRSRREAAPSEPPRFLQGDLFRFSEGVAEREARGLIVDSRYRLDVFIGRVGEGAITADRPFQDEQLDWSLKDSYTLQVLFAEPRQWDAPLKGTLKLSREGSSTKCHFVFSPTRAGPFAGRVTVYYRGRVLQTAVLEAIVVATASDVVALEKTAPLRFAVEAELRSSLGTLDDRRRFDVCLVLNHTTAGTSAMTAASGEGAYIASLDGIAPQLSTINGLLNQVALNSKRYGTSLLSKANAKLLCDLAAEGNLLYRSLVSDFIDLSAAAQTLRTAEYLQIVSIKPDAIIPLEFVYEYPPPKDGAPVCKNAKQALKEGECPKSCRPEHSPAPHVCPLGFWGLKKVIERHVHDPRLLKPAIVQSEPLVGRDVLPLIGPSLLAASKQVPTASRTRLEKAMQSARNGGVTSVTTWSNWRQAVQANKPVLLLALPHAAGTGSNISLEISGDVLKSIYIDKSYVRGNPEKPPPVVLLFGCDVANVAYTDAYARHIAVFRQADAALVLGTVATLLGADAARVAEKLIERLVLVAKKLPDRFGEVLRQVKREAVAESLMTAMCLVAFGDADWRLK